MTEPLDCGHVRGGDDPNGANDYETCDECGRLVCFSLDCPNGWRWGDDGGSVIGYHHDVQTGDTE